MLNRRKLLQLAAASTAAAVLPIPRGASGMIKKDPGTPLHADDNLTKAAGFTFCLNMATIRGHKLGFVNELKTAAKAGFRSVEIWMDSLQQYLDSGGSIREAASLINDLGIKVENCIGFAEWIVDDETRRSNALEQLKREMDVLAQLGCPRLAAPPMGATTGPVLDLKAVAERYRAILELGTEKKVIPQLELWGFSTNLKKVSEVTYVAMQSDHASSKVLLDMYHIYKGGSGVDTLHIINPSGMDIFHINDYPANIPAVEIKDSDRIYPADGIAPLEKVLSVLHNPAKPLVISFEVFNPEYYKQDPLLVCQTALRKMKAVTAKVAKKKSLNV